VANKIYSGETGGYKSNYIENKYWYHNDNYLLNMKTHLIVNFTQILIFCMSKRALKFPPG
jgi:hypothetical protein